ncbi:MAG: flagellar biosynthesis protein FliQ [Alphaproteobacteria bacterium]|jgi:flagellar biosynthetic protein FliQ|nr:flagellar biosynthesis protein FliQ [Alphaproteobacteria bacterium]
MNEAEAIEVGREAVMVVLTMSVPVMAVALGVGLVISLFQALTQLQEMTLVFVPKIIVVFVALVLLIPFMFATLAGFMEQIADRMIGLGGG